MSCEQPPRKSSLSEISHLFLSTVREKHSNGTPRPQRIPPGQAPAFAASEHPRIEMDQREPGAAEIETPTTSVKMPIAAVAGILEPARRTPPVTAVLAAHLNEKQFESVKSYARHLAAVQGRIGLIEVGIGEFRLMSFEPGHSELDPNLDEAQPIDCRNINELAEALEEMNWDVERWLILMPNPRTTEARAVLRAIDHWVLLSTCDHDGVVASYRMLKGFAESNRPRLSLALLDGDQSETQRVYQKLSGVCQQFLNWEMEDESVVRATLRVAEHLVLWSRPSREAGEEPFAELWWEMVREFLETLQAPPQTADPELAPDDRKELQNEIEAVAMPQEPAIPVPEPAPARSFTGPRLAGSDTAPGGPAAESVGIAPAAPALRAFSPARDSAVDVVDLPAEGGVESILNAILQQNHGELVECPVRPPMCPSARIAVTRDREMVLLAVAREGLSDLRSIGLAYRWISENRTLIAMAVPQFAIDPNRTARLRLLVDHADIDAGVLQPILQSDHVSVRAYRKLRWGGKTGLFLEAA